MLRKLFAATALLLPVYVLAADPPPPRPGNATQAKQGKFNGWGIGNGHIKEIGLGHSNHRHSAPEIDGTHLVLALGLIAGAVSLLRKKPDI